MKECPRCHEMTLEDEEVLNALSRRDSNTYICRSCGNEESFIDIGFVEPDITERDFVAKLEK